jgi:tetratricopeptide (TPR) repeat protein
MALFGLFAAPAVGGALSNVQVSKEKGKVAVDIHMSCSFRYDGHEPKGATKEVVIDLTLIGQCAGFNPNQPQLEMRKPSGAELAAVTEVEFNSYKGHVSMAVRFDTPQKITVNQKGGLRSLRVVVPYVGVKPEFIAAAERGDKPAPVPVAAAAMAVAAAPAVASVSETPDEIRVAPPMPNSRQLSAPDGATGGAFVINLLTAREKQVVAAGVAGASGKQLYTSVTDAGGVEWHHLRLGFYNSEGRAAAALVGVQTNYPDALVMRVGAAEFQVAATNPVAPAVAAAAVQTAPPRVPVAATGISEDRLAELMDEGRDAMLAANYAEAIQIYTKVLREGDTDYSPNALEYLGLARERKGQSAHAAAEYRRYLAEYPSDDGAERVQQRLDSLVVADTDPTTSVNAAGASFAAIQTQPKRARRDGPWEVYGGIAQYYRRDVNSFDEQSTQTSQSAILSDLDVVTRRRGERFNVATRMTMGNYYDMLSEDEGAGNDTRFYYLYADVADSELGLNARIGRQTLHTSGVLGRFDGAHVSWQFNPDWRVNFMTGEPVYSSSTSAEADRSFYGVSVDTFDVADLVDLSFYYNAQEINGIDDRQAIGGEMRYYDDRRSLVTYVDYDIGYNVLNSFVALGNWTFDNRLTLNASFDVRRTPYLLTENALVGQNADTIDELLTMFSEDEIRDMAADRSGEMTTMTLGFTRPMYERWQVNADITMSDFSGTPASANVAETPGSGNEYFYNLSFVGTSLMKEGDTTIFTLRYLDGSTVSTTSFSADTRLPLSERLRLNPRLLLSQRDFTTMDSTELLVIPALRLFYQFRRRTRFEFELGGRWSDRETNGDSTGAMSLFLYTGYRADF